MSLLDDEKWMSQALMLARQAEIAGVVPVGALLVKDDICIAEAFNNPISTQDPTAHAEITVLRQAASVIENYRIVGDTTLYVTLEPCVMCAGAMVHARIKRLVFGAYDPKAGGAGSVFSITDDPHLNHRLDVTGGILEAECSQLLKSFFEQRR